MSITSDINKLYGHIITLGIYKIMRYIKLDGFIIAMILPKDYQADIIKLNYVN
jgi:hypothetical protein